MTALRITTDEAAEVLGLQPTRLLGLATMRGWNGNDGTWARADIDAELASRDADNRRDGFTKAGAEKLAAQIRAYWGRRGRAAEVWVEPAGEYVDSLRTGTWYVVRSNLINGLPPR